MIEKIEMPKKDLHLLVCVHDRSNLPDPKKPSCSRGISIEDLTRLKVWLKENDLIKQVKLTKTGCLGVCSARCPVFMVYPYQEYYLYKSIDDIKEFISTFCI